jgi:hypothetical protein
MENLETFDEFINESTQTKIEEFDGPMDVIDALVKNYGKSKSSFLNTPTNKQRQKFWTFNRLMHFYFDIQRGDKERYRTVKKNGIYVLSKSAIKELSAERKKDLDIK